MLSKIRVIFLILVFLFSLYKIVSIVRLRNARIEITPINVIKDSQVYPISIRIDSINLNLPVTQANLASGVWEYSDTSVSYLKQTPTPGETGNTVFYGHNWPNLLGNLKNVKPGDKLSVELSNGEIKSFHMSQSFTITPDQTHILDQTEDTKVTIYTCTGFLDSKRLVVVFEPTY